MKLLRVPTFFGYDSYRKFFLVYVLPLAAGVILSPVLAGGGMFWQWIPVVALAVIAYFSWKERNANRGGWLSPDSRLAPGNIQGEPEELLPDDRYKPDYYRPEVPTVSGHRIVAFVFALLLLGGAWILSNRISDHPVDYLGICAVNGTRANDADCVGNSGVKGAHWVYYRANSDIPAYHFAVPKTAPTIPPGSYRNGHVPYEGTKKSN